VASGLAPGVLPSQTLAAVLCPRCRSPPPTPLSLFCCPSRRNSCHQNIQIDRDIVRLWRDLGSTLGRGIDAAMPSMIREPHARYQTFTLARHVQSAMYLLACIFKSTLRRPGQLGTYLLAC
jgi:hypothetical protein